MKLPDVKSDHFSFGGGLDLLTPAINLSPGKVFDSQNYEPQISGGYRRIDGFERFDGRASPSAANYYTLTYTLTGTISVGDTIASGLNTAYVLAVATGILIIDSLVGVFSAGNTLTVSGVPQGTATAAQQIRGSADASLDATYKSLAANHQRANILIPGGVIEKSPINGIWVYNDNVYCFHDMPSPGAPGGLMFKATASGWSQVTFPYEISFVTLTTSSVVTMTIASPCVVSYAAHPFVNGQPVVFSTTGALPTGLTVATTYYVVGSGAGTFNVSATSGGAAINTSGGQSGTHTCTAVGNTVTAGVTVTGVTSGATAVVVAALLRVGTWTNSAAGTLVLNTITGTFQNNEALKVSNLLLVTTASTADQITRLPGGSQMEFVNANFTGSTATTKMYGCDGINPAFEFDGTNYIPIHTGMTTDAPSHIGFHRNYLLLSFLGSVQLSALGNPYAWTTVLGAAEISTGDAVTGFVVQGGTSSGASLAIFTKTKTFILYGSSTSNFTLIPSQTDIGSYAFTAKLVSNNTYVLSNRGVQSLITTLTYGDFDYSSVSHLVQPIITAKRGMETCSTTLKTKNQYRLYFNDGTALVFGITGDKENGIMYLDYGIPKGASGVTNYVTCIVTATLSTGQEVTYFGSNSGYVYQDIVGTSADGNAIEAWVRPAFNNIKSPQIRKRFRRAVFEVQAEGYASVNVTYDLGYANPNVSQGAPQPNLTLTGQGGYWDQFTWDSFSWDTQVYATPSISIEGTEKNISFTFYSSSASDAPHCITGCSVSYTPQRIERTF